MSGGRGGVIPTLPARPEVRRGTTEMGSEEFAEILQRIDIKAWYETKRRNWKYIVDNTHLPIISSMIEDSISCTPFSVILKMGSHNEREEYRRKLIEHSIYPAILWSIPHDNSEDSDTAKIFSEQMLSIHCDGRYSLEDMCELSGLLNKLL